MDHRADSAAAPVTEPVAEPAAAWTHALLLPPPLRRSPDPDLSRVPTWASEPEDDADAVAAAVTGSAPLPDDEAEPTDGWTRADGGPALDLPTESPAPVDLLRQAAGQGASSPNGTDLDAVAAAADRVAGQGERPASAALTTAEAVSARTGVDVSAAVLHHDASAAGLATRAAARAFTRGRDVFFATGEFRPETTAGARLLAHELAHVAQHLGQHLGQRPDLSTLPRWAAGRTPSALARDPKKAPPPAADPDLISYSAAIPAEYTNLQQAFRLYERIAFGAEVNYPWHTWGTHADITKIRGTTITFQVPRSAVEARTDPAKVKSRKLAKDKLAAAVPGQQKAVKEEVDRRFQAETGDKPGQKIKGSDEGRQQQWEQKLDEVMGEQAKLDELPPAIKSLLKGKKELAPKDYQRLLTIAAKVKGLSEQDLAAFAWLTVRGTDNLDLFEQAVDLFLARKAELVKALQAAPNTPPPAAQPAKKDDLQSRFDAKLADLDPKALAAMSESDRYDLARRKTDELTAAQLTYMKDHPGETAQDFAKGLSPFNASERVSEIGKDLGEAANGDANTWARFAAGTGAGVKISGWVMAVAGVLYVASWLTGIGELATIAAVAGYALAATITLSAVESELRIKAASQTTDPEEFKRQIQLAAAAQANVIISVALIVIAAALHLVATTAFPKTVAKMRTSIAAFRERIRIKGSIYELKPTMKAEIGTHRAEVTKACAEARTKAAATAKELSAMNTEAFVERLESGNGDFLDQTKARPDQRINYKELTKFPEGRAALETYRQALIDAFGKDVPATIDKIEADYTAKIDQFVKDVDAATTHDQLGSAVDALEPLTADQHLKALMTGEQARLTQQKLATAAAELEARAKAAQTPPSAPVVPEPPATPPKPTQPAPTQPAPPKSAPADPVPTQPVPAKPAPADPAPTQPTPAKPAPADPAPTGPAQDKPAPPDPAQAQPAPSKPALTAAEVAAEAVKSELQVKKTQVELDLASVEKVRAELRALTKTAVTANEAVGKVDLEIARTKDATARAALETQRLEAIRARKMAGDDLRAFREKHDFQADSELDYQASALAAERAAIDKALNPAPGPVIDETKPLGGRRDDVPTQGGERNHMPADSANPYLSSGKGPSIRMDTIDHYATKSWGSGKAAKAWRAEQAKLIKEGKFLEALAKDIADIRGRNGAKYEKGIQQLLDYVAKDPEVRALSKNSTLTVDDLRKPASSPPTAVP